MVKISIVIPALNQELPIGRAIQQFWNPCMEGALEVIVADAGSGDGTRSVAELLADHVVTSRKSDDLWRSTARNAGAAKARGDVLLFVDPETRFLSSVPGMLDQLATVFGNGHRVAAALPAEDDAVGPERTSRRIGWMAVERSAFLACGGFDENLSEREEAELVKRVARHGAVQSLEGIDVTILEPAEDEMQEIAA